MSMFTMNVYVRLCIYSYTIVDIFNIHYTMYVYISFSKQAFQLSFKLIGRDKNRRLPDHSDSYLCTAFSNFFQRKISNVIDSLPRFDFALFDVTFITSSNHWSCFTLPSQAFVLSLVTSLKSHSPLDPVPLVLIRSISPYIIGLITNIINVSLITSTVPQSMKHSYITPLLKKPTLNTQT